jgi:hypothetical protein
MLRAEGQGLVLYCDSFRIVRLTAAGLCAYAIRNLISPARLVPRILAVGICFSLIYVPAFFLMRLPGWEYLSPERIQSAVSNQLSKMKRTVAQRVR